MTSKSSLILKRKIAAGGMGEVFEAFLEDEFGARYHVAAKKLKPTGDGSLPNLAAFKKELEISSKLSHPNVIRVLSCVEHDGDLFMISEFLEGLTLSDVLKDQQPLSLSEKFFIAISMLEAVLYAHNYKDPASLTVTPIVHRDISPQNVMLSIYGEVKLIDFGVASIEDLASEKSEPSKDIAGKLGYLAPEVLEGGSPDLNSDAYSLGVLLYYVFSGVHPFERTLSADTLQEIKAKSRPDLGELNRELSSESIDLINELISGDAKGRARLLKPLLQSLKLQNLGDVGSKDALAERVRLGLLESAEDAFPERTLTEKDFAKVSSVLRKKNRRRVVFTATLITLLALGFGEYSIFLWESKVESEALKSFAFKRSVQVENSDGTTRLLPNLSPESEDDLKKFFPDEETCWVYCSAVRSAASLIFKSSKANELAYQLNGLTGVHVYNALLNPFVNHDITNTLLIAGCFQHDLTKGICSVAHIEQTTIHKKFKDIFPLKPGGDLQEEAAIFAAAAINAKLARGRIDESKLEILSPLQILGKHDFSRLIESQIDNDFFIFKIDPAPQSDSACLRLASSLMAVEFTERILDYIPVLEEPVELLLVPKNLVLESDEGGLYRFKLSGAENKDKAIGVCRYVLDPSGKAFAKLYQVSF
jgi:serine/threonine-protein kinase